MNSHNGRKRKGDFTMLRMLKRIVPLVIALGLFAFQTVPAFACGGLFAPNGAIRLSRATTLVSWHDGIERYMTSFTYQENNTNSGANLGWIVPLPAVPLKIEEGGAWTLQRLSRETHPLIEDFAGVTQTASLASKVEVLQQVKID